MSEGESESQAEGRPDRTQSPDTGDREIDEAMEQVSQLEELPVADHHDVLSPAHDALQQALHRDHSAPSGGN